MSRDAPLDILIVGLNYAPERIGIAIYTTGVAENLVKRGHTVRVIAGVPYYPAWSVPEEFRTVLWKRGKENGVDVTRVNHFVPARPTGRRRVLHHLTFAFSSSIALIVSALKRRPDIVITVAPSIIAAPSTAFVGWLLRIPTWIHIQDYEVEAAAATGLVQKAYALRLATFFERKILRSFNRVSSISPAMCMRSVKKGVPAEHVVEFRNWADIAKIVPSTERSPFREAWGIDRDHVALYSGNIANKQGIDIVVEAARALRHRQDIQFIICGEGPNRAHLQVLAAGLTNIQFHDLQPAERLCDLLSLATVHLLPQLADAADLVLPSKLANMLASGRPVIVTADSHTSLALEVEGCGLVVQPGDTAALADAIEYLVDNPNDREKLGKAARIQAEKHWEREMIIEGFEHQLISLRETGRKTITRKNAT